MLRAVVFLVMLTCFSTFLSADDKPLTEEKKKRVEELKKQIADKKGELSKLEAELGKLTSGNLPGLNEWVQVGDVRVRIAKVRLQKATVVSSGLGDKDTKSDSTEQEMMMWVEVENVSKTKKILYGRWTRDRFGSTKTLTDEYDNEYRIEDHSGLLSDSWVEGGLRYSTKDMRPGEAAFTDIICFERPVDAAKELVLTLRAVSNNDKGSYRFKIPSSAWKEDKK